MMGQDLLIVGIILFALVIIAGILWGSER